MSRFIRTIEPFLEKPLKSSLIREILETFQKNISPEKNLNRSSIEFKFNLPYYKRSPVSGYVFPEFYPCSFEGLLDNGVFKFREKVTVQYASYCPCSAELCQNGAIGYPHAQRSLATVLVEVNLPSILWLEDIVEMVESSVQTVTYPIITREDELAISEIAKLNCQFVEDSVRSIANTLLKDKRIAAFDVKCIHKESIHKSSAFARITTFGKKEQN